MDDQNNLVYFCESNSNGGYCTCRNLEPGNKYTANIYEDSEFFEVLASGVGYTCKLLYFI